MSPHNPGSCSLPRPQLVSPTRHPLLSISLPCIPPPHSGPLFPMPSLIPLSPQPYNSPRPVFTQPPYLASTLPLYSSPGSLWFSPSSSRPNTQVSPLHPSPLTPPPPTHNVNYMLHYALSSALFICRLQFLHLLLSTHPLCNHKCRYYHHCHPFKCNPYLNTISKYNRNIINSMHLQYHRCYTNSSSIITPLPPPQSQPSPQSPTGNYNKDILATTTTKTTKTRNTAQRRRNVKSEKAKKKNQ